MKKKKITQDKVVYFINYIACLASCYCPISDYLYYQLFLQFRKRADGGQGQIAAG